MANDIQSLIKELRRRNELQSQSQMGGAPSFQGTPNIGGLTSAPQAGDYSGQQQQQAGGQDILQGLNNANKMSNGRLYNKMGQAAKSGWQSLMGNTGLQGSGSMLGSQTTGTLANMGATNMGAGMGMGPASLPTASSMGFGGAGSGGSALSGFGGAGGLGGMMSGAGAVAWPAAIIAALDKTGVSSFKDTMKGRAGSNIMEKIGIRKTGGGALEQGGKGILQAMSGDFGGAWKNTKDSVKNLFRLKLF